MKTIILCGGLGTRLAEETVVKPKPMVEIGDKPIMWHIMNWYNQFDYNDFVLALGYKGEYIKNYFLNYYSMQSDLKVNLKTGEVDYTEKNSVDWSINLIDTGLNSLTGGRLYNLKNFLNDEETFMLTYGDGVANVNIKELVSFHKSHGKIATVTAVRPPARFGEMIFGENNLVTEFAEKPQTTKGWINGGFFVFNKEIFNYLDKGDMTILERAPLENLAKDGQLKAFKHSGFWQCMDTIRDKNYLNEIWSQGEAPWKNR